MTTKIKSINLLSMLILGITLLTTFMTAPATAQNGTVYVDPSYISDLPPTASFTVNLNIADVEDVFAWGIILSWNPKLLTIASPTDVVEGGFLIDVQGATGFTKVINNLEGYVDMGCTTIGDIPGVSGSGTLVSITFTVRDVGETPLHFNKVELLHQDLSPFTPDMVIDGYFSNVALLPISANLVQKSAWPEHHHFVIIKDEDNTQTLYAIVKNLASNDVYVRAAFDLVREDGKTIHIETTTEQITPGTAVTLSVGFGPLVSSDVGKYEVAARALYSYAGYMWYEGAKLKTFSFAAV